MKYYAWRTDEAHGTTTNWTECQKAVTGHKGARYKKFRNREEAELWLASGAQYDHLTMAQGIYFDAGTGSGRQEVLVTDEASNPLVQPDDLRDLAFPVTLDGAVVVVTGMTNNFGELLGLFLALRIAERTDAKLIGGDSRLVIDYWSLGHWRRDSMVHQPTIELIQETKQMREEFTLNGGIVRWIPGRDNPADLGYHG